MTSPPASAIHHVVLQVGDLARSTAFYRDVLGLQPQPDDICPETQPHACFEAGDGGYLILVEPELAEAPPAPECLYFAMVPDEWRSVQGRLVKSGCPMLVDRQGGMRGTGELRVRIADPDGNVLDLHAFEPSFYEVPPAGLGKIVVGPLEQFPVGSVTRVPRGCFFLVHLEAGFLAISEVCTHRQFTISYQPEHYRFYCPLHGNRYSQTGKLTHKGAREDTPPLHVYPIELVDGQIVVNADVSLPRATADADLMVPLGQ